MRVCIACYDHSLSGDWYAQVFAASPWNSRQYSTALNRATSAYLVRNRKDVLKAIGWLSLRASSGGVRQDDVRDGDGLKFRFKPMARQLGLWARRPCGHDCRSTVSKRPPYVDPFPLHRSILEYRERC